MNLNINPKYNTYSLSIILHLLHHSEDYNDIWVSNYPSISSQLKNFFNDENCGCKSIIVQNYYKFRFEVDLFTVKFLNDNPKVLDLENFCEQLGRQDLRGTIFSIKNSLAEYKEFLSTLHQKRAYFNNFNSIVIDNNIVFSFF